ncbi:MAG: DegV family EDD domain-containing protein [Lachnospiraceae bacterium]|nr:DegV family EDD domain-containing protein [Lachnospiraceae bacterium]
MIGIIRNIKNYMRDPSIDFQTRSFVLGTLMGLVGVFVALIGDIIFGENIVEIIVLAMALVVVPIVMIITIKFNYIHMGAVLITLGVIFIILPVCFFFGGGPDGGSIIWVSFCFLYIGVMITGKLRYILLALLSFATILEYIVAFRHPELIHQHDKIIYYDDSIFAVITLGFVTFIMVLFQNQLYKDENKRAVSQAEKVDELNKAQNRFFSNMSHEIRTPINTILGLNEITLRRNDLPEEVLRDARNIEGAGKMLLSIINDILDMSKLASGKMDVVPVNYRVADMLSEIVNMIWSRAEAKGLRFKVDIDPHTPTELFGDVVRIQQIVINLLTNAVKYTKSGMIRLYIESDDIGNNEVLITIAVTDTGMGIKKEALPYLFEAFKRVDEEQNINIEGTGLGLSIVKQIVDLMGGEITVNSVYTQGSTFVVKIRQVVIDRKEIGTSVIGAHPDRTNANMYKQMFEAPEADILIVDDNELNLEVEVKLLEATKMNIDTVKSGAEALNMALRKRYDVILMDHLMPEMDGVECLKKLRMQTGGLNRTTPVIVLTANADSENQDLYRSSGFDGYLSKPVSGSQLESVLMMNLPGEKVLLTGTNIDQDERGIESDEFTRKAPVIITTSSMADIPKTVIRNLNIGVIPFKINTESGVFYDGEELVSGEIIDYIENTGKFAYTESPDVIEFEEFFAEQLVKGRHIIHITIANGILLEYERATQASKAFGNVTIVDSGKISAATGLMVMVAGRLAQQNYDINDIVKELSTLKSRLGCSYIIDSTGYIFKSGQIKESMHMLFQSFRLHPVIGVKNGKRKVIRVYAGTTGGVYKRYIDRVFSRKRDIDRGILFVIYVGIREEELKAIEKEIKKKYDFECIVFQAGSASMSINCGPGMVGLFYIEGNSMSYNLNSFISKDNDYNMDNMEINVKINPEVYDKNKIVETKGTKWYEKLEGIDGETGIRNCGAEDSYKSVLDIFYNSIDNKRDEIEGYYKNEDWNNYTIKVHALKSSARIIGAAKLGEMAEKMESAGKNNDIDFIKSEHSGFMQEYGSFKAVLERVCELDESVYNDGEDIHKPLADYYMIEVLYDALRTAADSMDIEAVESALKELEDYSLPDDVESNIRKIRKAANTYDYDGILDVLNKSI